MSNSSSGVEAMVLGGSSSCRSGGRLWVVKIWRGAGVQRSESKAVVNNDKESVLKLVFLGEIVRGDDRRYYAGRCANENLTLSRSW